ncbi:helix-turn-helix domain-containing protein [Ensifer soli]|uniref:helix-turn-helix domain-containing protein n=1 Tax=Ciceribacter sp. sgz301302 TaxID=3342379 RepID=UPI0035B6B0F5
MGKLLDIHRRYDLQPELEKALNRVDFFRLFHTLALKFGLDHFGVLQIGVETVPCMLANRLMLHDLPSGLAEEYDKRHRFGDSALFRSLHQSAIPSVWRGDETGIEKIDNLVAQLGFDLLVCVPTQAPTGMRYAVLFLGDEEDIGRPEHMELCYAATCIFDYFYRLVLSNKVGMGLTPREREILKWISHGKTASEIALIVSVSEHTINSHTATILKKLDVVNRTQMVAKAIREQIIQ